MNSSETIISNKYAQQIDAMNWKLKCLKPALVNRKGPAFPHDYDWPHVAQATLQKLNELDQEVLPHLPYSPELLLTDYHLYKQQLLQGKDFFDQQDEENYFQQFI